MAYAKLMTHLLPQNYNFLHQESRRQKRTIRDILEEAIALYRKEKKKELIRRAYVAMAEDKEYLQESLSLAEEGMAYFLKDLEHA